MPFSVTAHLPFQLTGSVWYKQIRRNNMFQGKVWRMIENTVLLLQRVGCCRFVGWRCSCCVQCGGRPCSGRLVFCGPVSWSARVKAIPALLHPTVHCLCSCECLCVSSIRRSTSSPLHIFNVCNSCVSSSASNLVGNVKFRVSTNSTVSSQFYFHLLQLTFFLVYYIYNLILSESFVVFLMFAIHKGVFHAWSVSSRTCP